GVLLFIPGGPGVGISGALGDFRAIHHIDELAREWDVVSFDPRGIGESSPIRCAPDAIPPVIAPFDRPPSPAEFEAIARANTAYIESCVEGPASWWPTSRPWTRPTTSSAFARRSLRTRAWWRMPGRTAPS